MEKPIKYYKYEEIFIIPKIFFALPIVLKIWIATKWKTGTGKRHKERKPLDLMGYIVDPL